MHQRGNLDRYAAEEAVDGGLRFGEFVFDFEGELVVLSGDDDELLVAPHGKARVAGYARLVFARVAARMLVVRYDVELQVRIRVEEHAFAQLGRSDICK